MLSKDYLTKIILAIFMYTHYQSLQKKALTLHSYK